ncbi:MAG: hypothetical protein LW847_02185 [Burkholderiales bacterium]|jgi:hypothetical protein|nr:hypothetical protein [Burkholderiales bacterium]
MRPIPTLLSGLLAACLLAAPAAVLAAKTEAKSTAKAEGVTNDDCLACHDDPKEKNKAGKVIGLDEKKFAASAHGDGAANCIDCHTDAKGDPHPEKLKPVDCASCHDDSTSEFHDSIHAKAAKDGKNAVDCQSCHGPVHYALPASNPESATASKNVDKTCGTCHGDTAKAGAGGMPGGNVLAKFERGMHGKAIAEGSGRAPNCVSCHGAHGILAPDNPKSRVSSANVTDTCGNCHQRAKIVFGHGVHGKLHQQGDKNAPTCVSCHAAHDNRSAGENDWQVAVAGQCGDCHQEYMQSFKLSYHGKVTQLGYAAATCASCHGAHDILPASNPNSPIAPENRLQTCRKCHQEATARFASWDPHPEPHNKERSPIVYYATLFMNILLAGVFLFFGAHTLLWAYRSIKDAAARRRGGQ